MSRKLLIPAAIAALLAGAVPAISQQDPATEAQMKASAPGPEHKRLEALAGKWTLKMSVWFTPGTAPAVFEGTSERKVTLGGRFLESEFTATSKAAGMTMSGTSIVGFNNFAKGYEMTTVGSGSTVMRFLTGAYDESAKAIIVSGTADEGMPTKTRMVMHDPEKDRSVTEIFFTHGDNPEERAVEMVFTKKK